jgi:hypothetical protein
MLLRMDYANYNHPFQVYNQEMNSHFITKFTKYFLYGFMAVCFVNIISNIMQINLVNDYSFRNLYSDDIYQSLQKGTIRE